MFTPRHSYIVRVIVEQDEFKCQPYLYKEENTTAVRGESVKHNKQLIFADKTVQLSID